MWFSPKTIVSGAALLASAWTYPDTAKSIASFAGNTADDFLMWLGGSGGKEESSISFYDQYPLMRMRDDYVGNGYVQGTEWGDDGYNTVQINNPMPMSWVPQQYDEWEKSRQLLQAQQSHQAQRGYHYDSRPGASNGYQQMPPLMQYTQTTIPPQSNPSYAPPSSLPVSPPTSFYSQPPPNQQTQYGNRSQSLPRDRTTAPGAAQNIQRRHSNAGPIRRPYPPTGSQQSSRPQTRGKHRPQPLAHTAPSQSTYAPIIPQSRKRPGLGNPGNGVTTRRPAPVLSTRSNASARTNDSNWSNASEGGRIRKRDKYNPFKKNRRK